MEAHRASNPAPKGLDADSRIVDSSAAPAASKKHLGLYPGGEATAAFAEELRGWDVSKGTIRIPWDRELPEELIRKIARWCYEKYAKA